MLENVKQKLIALRNKAEEAGASLVPNPAPENIAAERWAICQSCEHLYTPTNTCKVCGCFMKVKTNMAYASCPKKKWLATQPKP